MKTRLDMKKLIDYGLHPAAYFICFGFKVLTGPDVEQIFFLINYFNIVKVKWKL